MKTLKIRDLTLRDGQQSAFATRMTQTQIDRVLPLYKDAGFYALEVWGGAVPDSIMRYLGENPWTRLEKIHATIGPSSLLTALSRGRNLFGYQPYPDEIIEGFCRNSIASGLGVMRIFDALNDVDNIASTVKYVKQYGGIADCAVCYTIDPKHPRLSLVDKIRGRRNPAPVFTDEYFLDKVKRMVDLGADMVTIKDMSGLIPPRRVYDLVTLFKKHTSVPIDFHTHCTPGYGLASVVSAIAAGVDVVDTNIWNFAGGPAAPAIELVWIFARKMGVELDLNMSSVAKINRELGVIRGELADFDAVKCVTKSFDPLHDPLPADLDALVDRAAHAAAKVDEKTLIEACHRIEAHFGFPPPNELVKNAEIPGGMYTNMVAQLRQLGNEDILPRAMELIPSVRLDAGLPPLVTPTSQIVGVQAVNCAMDEKNGKPLYTTKSVQFVNLVRGEYGHTPVPVRGAFREKITGSSVETNYDTSRHKMQPNPILEQCGGVRLAENEKEVLLLELFPTVARDFLTNTKCAAHAALAEALAADNAARAEAAQAAAMPAITALTIDAPLPGRVLSIMVKPGDEVSPGTDIFVLEAMKMENTVAAETPGRVKRLLVTPNSNVAAGQPIVELDA